jgi:hypothetical protein
MVLKAAVRPRRTPKPADSNQAFLTIRHTTSVITVTSLITMLFNDHRTQQVHCGNLEIGQP